MLYEVITNRVREDYPATAKMLDAMATEEMGHHNRLIELHKHRFGDVIPLIRREHVAGYYARTPTRITSYNVCYTKLLRAGGAQLGPLLGAQRGDQAPRHDHRNNFV